MTVLSSIFVGLREGWLPEVCVLYATRTHPVAGMPQVLVAARRMPRLPYAVSPAFEKHEWWNSVNKGNETGWATILSETSTKFSDSHVHRGSVRVQAILNIHSWEILNLSFTLLFEHVK